MLDSIYDEISIERGGVITERPTFLLYLAGLKGRVVTRAMLTAQGFNVDNQNMDSLVWPQDQMLVDLTVRVVNDEEMALSTVRKKMKPMIAAAHAVGLPTDWCGKYDVLKLMIGKVTRSIADTSPEPTDAEYEEKFVALLSRPEIRDGRGFALTPNVVPSVF